MAGNFAEVFAAATRMVREQYSGREQVEQALAEVAAREFLRVLEAEDRGGGYFHCADPRAATIDSRDLDIVEAMAAALRLVLEPDNGR